MSQCLVPAARAAQIKEEQEIGGDVPGDKTGQQGRDDLVARLCGLDLTE